MPRSRFIVNPVSGRNRHRPQLAGDLRTWLSAHGVDGEVLVTEAPGHATALAAEAVAQGCERVVAVGGDGTMNEVARALLHTRVAFGLVPCGSGNGLGRQLGIRGSLNRTLAILQQGRVIVVDTATAAGHPFVNVMGVGLDAEIARRFNALPSRGLQGYVQTGLRAFFQHRATPYSLSDGTGWQSTVTAFVVAVANSPEYGNGARIAPGAQVDDGQLDLVVVPPVGLGGAVGLAIRMFAGNITRHPRVLHRRAAAFTIRREAPGVIHVDGETREAGAVIEIRVLPLSLRIVVPEGRVVK